MFNNFARLALGNGNNENDPPNTEGVLTLMANPLAKPLSTKRQAILSKMKQERNAASSKLAKEADEQLSKLLAGANTLLQRTATIDSRTENMEAQIEHMKGMITNLSQKLEGSNPEQAKKVKDTNVLLRKQVTMLQKQLEESRKAQAEAEKKLVRDKNLQIKGTDQKKSTLASRSAPTHLAPRVEQSISGHIGKERACDNFEHSVKAGVIKEAPAFGPGRRHRDGKLGKKKSPFKLKMSLPWP